MPRLSLLTAGAATIALCSMAAVAQQVPPSQANQFRHGQLMHRAAELRADWASRMALGETPATVTEPSLKSGKILTPDIDVTKAPGVPAFSATLDSGTVGVDYLELEIQSPSQTQYYENGAGFTIPLYPPKPENYTVKFQGGYPFGNGPASLYLAPGAYTIVGATLLSKDGTFVSYDQTQVSAMFPSLVINVANSGTPDTTPPTAGRGKILTPTVSTSGSSPYFAVKVPVTDNLSGVANVSVEIALPGGGFGFSGGSSFALPIIKGNAIAYLTLPSGSVAGTYTISDIFVCDVASNCLFENTPAEIKAILGATTFEVTN